MPIQRTHSLRREGKRRSATSDEHQSAHTAGHHNLTFLNSTIGNLEVQRLLAQGRLHVSAGASTSGGDLGVGRGFHPASSHLQRSDVPKADLGAHKSSRAYMLNWHGEQKGIKQDAVLSVVFEEKLAAQLQRFFGEALTQDQAVERIQQAETDGNAAEAERLSVLLNKANQFAVAETLNVENSDRYQKKKNAETGKTSTYCNIYAYDMVTALGGYLPRVWWTSSALKKIQAGEAVKPVYGKTVNEQNANMLTDWMVEFGKDFGWRMAADMTEAQDSANQGKIVILLAAQKPVMTPEGVKKQRPGHVSVVMPEIRAEDNVRDAEGNVEVHEAKRDKDGDVTKPMQSQAGGSNFEYEAKAANWVTSEKYRDGHPWIFEGTRQSPIITPEQFGDDPTSTPQTPESPQTPGVSPAEPQTPEAPKQNGSQKAEGDGEWLKRAVRLNTHYGQKLWNAHFDAIVVHFQNKGYLPPLMSPGAELFAEAARQYQGAVGLTPDGIVGRNTWGKLQKEMGLAKNAGA